MTHLFGEALQESHIFVGLKVLKWGWWGGKGLEVGGVGLVDLSRTT